jgi:hypothetical protein
LDKVAVAVLDELQVTDVVRFCVLPSVYAPVAVNCCVVPWTIDGLAGVTEMDTNCEDVTVKVLVPLMTVAGSVAVMVVVPTATEVANPFEPVALLIVAVAVLDELQVIVVVRVCVELSV